MEQAVVKQTVFRNPRHNPPGAGGGHVHQVRLLYKVIQDGK